jgi:hypothetical protein
VGCSSCGGGKSAAKYPYEAVMPDGTRVMVSSAAQERVEKDNARARMREASRGNGYSVHDA